MTEETKAEVKVEKWGYCIGIGAILLVLFSIFDMHLWSTVGAGIELRNSNNTYAGILLFMTFTSYILSKANMKLRLSTQQIALIWILIVGMGTMPVGFYGGFPPAIFFAKWEEPLKTNVGPYMPSLWGPTDLEVYRGLFEGGFKNANWGPWATPIAYWILYNLMVALCGLFVTFLFLKPWHEIEMLPFPAIVPAYEIMKYAGAQDRPFLFDIKKSKWLWIGFMIGIGVSIPDYLIWFFPNIPVYHHFGATPLDFTPYIWTFLPGSVSWMLWLPGWFWVSFFAPMDVLWTFTLAYVIFYMIYPAMGITLGILPPVTTGSAGVSMYGLQEGPIRHALWGGGSNGIGGMYFALALWPIILHRKYLASTLKGFLTGKKEEGLPFSWRVIWTAILMTGVIFMILLVVAGVPPLMAILVWIFQQLILLAMARWTGEGGWANEYQYLFGEYLMDIGVALGQFPGRPYISQGSLTTQMAFGAPIAGGNYNPTLAYSIAQYEKVAVETKLPMKQFAIAAITMITISCVIGVPLYIWFCYRYGLTATMMVWGSSKYNPRGVVSTAYTIVSKPSPAVTNVNPWPYWVFGWVLGLVLFALRTRFAWFFIHPVGLIAGLSSWHYVVFFTMLVGFAVKLLFVKIGGARGYENIGIPMISGYTGGYFVSTFFYTTISAIPKLMI